jgi:hypothetical protein
MKQSSANTQAEIVLIRKGRLNFESIVQKPYAAEGRSLLGTELNANPTQCRDPVRHKAFRASFINGRLRPIRHNNIEAVLPGGKRGCEPGRTAANDEDVGFQRSRAAVHDRTKVIFERSREPMAWTKPKVPATGASFMRSVRLISM